MAYAELVTSLNITLVDTFFKGNKEKYIENTAIYYGFTLVLYWLPTLFAKNYKFESGIVAFGLSLIILVLGFMGLFSDKNTGLMLGFLIATGLVSGFFKFN